jgi:ubiquinone/menaquinone biosynthesis C-methylase UbiE
MYESLARFYDLVHSSLTADRDYILELAERLGGPVLELGCGTGRLLIPLARTGHAVTGVDNSPAMLNLARRRLEQELPEVKTRVELVEADMKSLNLKKKEHHFALVLLPYNTLLHFQEDEISQLLRRISRYIQKKGYIFIDVANPFAIDQIEDDPQPTLENTYLEWKTGKSVRQLSQSRLSLTDQCLHTTWIFEVISGSAPGPDLTIVEFDYWYYYPHQLQLRLQQAGFHLEEILGNYDGSAFSQESERLILIAQSSLHQ